MEIIPLSYNPELNRNDIPGLDIYYSEIASAFKNPRIRNIALTGQRGIGKSSLIRSFDEHKRVGPFKKPNFLYVSLGEYENYKTDETRKVYDTKDTKLREVNEQNAIERRILLQICSRFKGGDFPASGLRIIPQKPAKHKMAEFVLFGMSILILTLKSSLSELIINLPVLKDNEKVLQVLLYGETLLYAIVLVGATAVLQKCFVWFKLKGQIAGLTLKTSKAELNLGEDFDRKYLDQYAQELVYYLVQIGSKIDYTVVFEDMDRLDRNICINIFTRLREINFVLNADRAKKKKFRFIYVVNEDIAAYLEYEKFFDFIIPVVPTLNRNSSEEILREKLQIIHDDLERDFFKDNGKIVFGRGQISKQLQDDTESIIQMAAKYLTDFRTMFAILDEYSLMMKLDHCANGARGCYTEAEKILAFQIYKHLWPQDYQNVLKGKKSVLTGMPVSAFAGKNKELLIKLLSQKMLSINCLYSVGYSKEKIKLLWEDFIRLKGLKTAIERMDSEILDQRELVREHCRVQEDDDQISEALLEKAILFLMAYNKMEDSYNEWLFAGRDREKCLNVITKMKEDLREQFIIQCKAGKDRDIFEKCKDNIEYPAGKWSAEKAKVYKTCVPFSKLKGKEIWLDNGKCIMWEAL